MTDEQEHLTKKDMMNMKTMKTFAAALTGGALLTAGLCAMLSAQASEQSTPKPQSMGLIIDDHPLARDAKLGFSYAGIVKKVLPSVVNIEVTTAAKETPMQNIPGLQENPFFRQFFGNQFFGGQQRMYTPPEHGAGSGVIVTKDGYILTNNHVVDDADKVKVKMQDGREFTAKVVGKDPESDVAVVKIDAHDLPAISIADSAQIEVGDVVLAIGNPFDLGQTVTMGIISATGRATMDLKYQDFIQTDAAINPGNSGGALVDMEGRLIGINTAIFSRSGGNQGIGFAIPTDLARTVMVSLVTTGKVTRGQLGVRIQPITPALARKFDLKSEKGVLIGEVMPDSPASKAGLQSGDVILQFNGKDIVDTHQLQLEVAGAAPGEKVPVRVWHDGAAKTVEVVVNQQKEEKSLAKNDSSPSDSSDTLQGVGVADLNSEMRQQLSVPENIKGAVVTQVDPGSAAADAGLKQGDVILEINKHSVRSADEAVKLTTNAKDKITLLHVWSSDGSHYLVVDESKAG
jgi:serine protease Do